MSGQPVTTVQLSPHGPQSCWDRPRACQRAAWPRPGRSLAPAGFWISLWLEQALRGCWFWGMVGGGGTGSRKACVGVLARPWFLAGCLSFLSLSFPLFKWIIVVMRLRVDQVWKALMQVVLSDCEPQQGPSPSMDPDSAFLSPVESLARLGLWTCRDTNSTQFSIRICLWQAMVPGSRHLRLPAAEGLLQGRGPGHCPGTV